MRLFEKLRDFLRHVRCIHFYLLFLKPIFSFLNSLLTFICLLQHNIPIFHRNSKLVAHILLRLFFGSLLLFFLRKRSDFQFIVVMVWRWSINVGHVLKSNMLLYWRKHTGLLGFL